MGRTVLGSVATCWDNKMKTITFTLEDLDWAVLQDEIVSPEAWIEQFTADRIRRHKDKIISREQTTLIEDPDVEAIPASHEGILQSYFGRDGYMTRAEEVAAASNEEP